MLQKLNKGELWFKSFCRASSRLAEIICEIEQAKISIQPLHYQETTAGPGIIFFDGHTKKTPLTECIIEQAPLCERQIIAVSLDAIPNGLSWELLSAGASDVFVWSSIEKPTLALAAKLDH